MKYEYLIDSELTEIAKMKCAGHRKPPHVSRGDWELGPRWNAKYNAIVTMTTKPGRSQREVARIFGITPTWLSIVCSSSKGRLLVRECHEEREKELRAGFRAWYQQLMRGSSSGA